MQDADAVVLLTEWNEFRALDLKTMADRMSRPRMVDLRNIYNAKDAKRAGFETYVAVGRTRLSQSANYKTNPDFWVAAE